MGVASSGIEYFAVVANGSPQFTRGLQLRERSPECGEGGGKSRLDFGPFPASEYFQPVAVFHGFVLCPLRALRALEVELRGPIGFMLGRYPTHGGAG